MNKVHKIKLSEYFCDDVLNGRKCFEIRENDRGYQAGDHVKFICVDSMGINWKHPVEDQEYVITYVLSGWGIKEGYVAFGIKPLKEGRTEE